MCRYWKRVGAACCAALLLGLLVIGRVLPAKADYAIIPDEAVPMAAINPGPGVLVPQASGIQVYSNEYATVDTSNVSQGYVMVNYNKIGDGMRIKVRISRSGGTTYTYDLATDGHCDVYPLTQGNGAYTIAVYRNIKDTQYAKVLVQNVSVQLADGLLPFLYPNMYVNFTPKSETVKMANQLAVGAQGELGVVEKVYNYVLSNISYDYPLAANTPVGYVPNPDSVLLRKKGICFDYASVMSAMLRSQGIPTKLVVGYTSKGEYHAWISTHISEIGWINGVISFNGKEWKIMDPTFASTGKSSKTVLEYINNPANYTEKYIY